MTPALPVARRNLLIFFRDPLNVFFSLLGAIILFVLYALFLGSLQANGVAQSVPGVDPGLVQAFVDSWMFAGIVLITTVTTGLGAYSVLVDDRHQGRIRDFLVAPIRRWQLVVGYLISAAAISVVMSTLVLIVSVLYLGVLRGAWLDPMALLTTFGCMVLSCVAFTALFGFIATFVRTPGAFGGLASIVGSVLGFVAGASLPVGLLPKTVGDIINALPFAQAGALIREQFSGAALDRMTATLPGAAEGLRHYFGMDVLIGDWIMPPGIAIAVLVVILVVFTALAAWRLGRRSFGR